MFKVNEKNNRIISLMSFLSLTCRLKTFFTPCSIVSIADFEYVMPIRIVKIFFAAVIK